MCSIEYFHSCKPVIIGTKSCPWSVLSFELVMAILTALHGKKSSVGLCKDPKGEGWVEAAREGGTA